jgi:hypothetical protein
MNKHEAILKAREKNKAGDFDSTITSRTPVDIATDEITLDCGHSMQVMDPPIRRDNKQYCWQCARDWMKQAAHDGFTEG